METNFKVDVPSFVLGYSEGRKKGGGGVELNIHYSLDTPPEDTSKLWVKSNKPNAIESSFEKIGEEVVEISEKLPLAGYNGNAVSVGNKVYLLCRNDDDGDSNAQAIIMFDAETERAEELNAIVPQKRTAAAAASVGDNIYIFGGGFSGTCYNTILRFNTATRVVDTVSETLPYKINGSCAVTVGKKIYLIGAYATTNSSFSNIMCFDTETEKTDILDAKFPSSRYNMKAAAVGNKIYAFGGTLASGGSTNEIFCFDTETQNIEKLDLSFEFRVFGCTTFDGKIYIFGGYKNGERTNLIHCFDPSEKKIEQFHLHLPSPVSNAEARAANGKIYIFGGKTPDGSTKSISCYFNNHKTVPNKDILLILSATENIFTIINTDTAKISFGVTAAYKGNEESVGEKAEVAIYKDGEWVNI